MTYFRDNIESLAGYTPGFQPARTDVVKLNTNENPWPPSPTVMEALRRLPDEKLRRYPQPMADDFRQAASEVLGISPSCIMAVNGGDDLLTIAVRSFCDQWRAMAYPTPTYSLYPVLARIQECDAVEIPFAEDFGIPEALYEVDASLVVVCNPNAPTGSFISPDELGRLAAALQDRAVLLIDEAYVDYAETNCLALTAEFDNVILLRSLSKGYSLAGLRFGYAVACQSLIEGMTKVKDSYNVDAMAIAAATAAIRDQAYFHENIEKIKAQRAILTQDLRRLGLDVRDSRANFVLARCPNGDAADLHEALARRGIYVRYFPLPHLEDKLRITVGTEAQNAALIGTLKELLRQ
ncbi:MAG: histidinol-phosphate transaminase [Phycisphaerae bacterium]|nr:histidinol-phosphate transaminase [Phycisphaerae bacterium]